MFISLKNNQDLKKQEFSTSCWISVSYFVLKHLNVNVTLHELHAKYYKPDHDSIMLMTGAGNPSTILNNYIFDEGRFIGKLSPDKASKADIVSAIKENIENNIPVIACIRSNRLTSYAHALVITGIDPDTGHIIYKDPAIGNSPRLFGIDVRGVPFNLFFKEGFSYRFHRTLKEQIFTYCTHIYYLRPLNEMTLF